MPRRARQGNIVARRPRAKARRASRSFLRRWCAARRRLRRWHGRRSTCLIRLELVQAARKQTGQTSSTPRPTPRARRLRRAPLAASQVPGDASGEPASQMRIRQAEGWLRAAAAAAAQRPTEAQRLRHAIGAGRVACATCATCARRQPLRSAARRFFKSSRDARTKTAAQTRPER